MLYRKHELEIYLLRDAQLHMYFPTLLVFWVQIQFSNWMERQWQSTSEVTFPNVSLLWERLDYQEFW